MAFAAHQSWTRGDGGPLTQNHVTTPSIITRHATAIIPSRVIFVAQKQKTPAGAFPQESLVSPRETVHGGLHRRLFFAMLHQPLCWVGASGRRHSALRQGGRPRGLTDFLNLPRMAH